MLLGRWPQTLTDWLVLLAIAVVVFGATYFIERSRREGVKRVAAELGFSFDAKGETLHQESEFASLLALSLLERNTGLSNVLRGSLQGMETIILDCRVGSGKQALTQTVACFRLARKSLPQFELRPENILHKIGAAFGYQGIDFEQDPEFSKTYLLRGKDEAAVRGLFHQGLLAFLGKQPRWCVEGGGEWLALYRQAKTVRAGKISRFLEEARQVCTAFASSL